MKKYLINSKIDEEPCVANVLAIKQNIPNGAIIITNERIFITISLKSSKNFFNEFNFLKLIMQLPD